ncbi:DUF7619 domain-containing protein [Flavobacterium flavigenum]|uniref:DUF7619 domain-containing protein n=1 Tax=Flavobacterium flavigenum TaxID=3003258 RepID=UPI0022ABDD69|nr:T9SS type A sorting domain-containing protein [Flavobacterium flavigenum]
MKKIYFLVLALGFFNGLSAQIVNIPDANFKAKLLDASSSNNIAKNLNGDWFKIDSNFDRELQLYELKQVSYLNIHKAVNIGSLEGIRSFENLKYLDCSSLLGNTRLNSLDVSGLSNLEGLECANNYITTMNVDGLINLKSLSCNNNLLTSLTVINLPVLEALSCKNNQLLTLNVSSLPKLVGLDCENNFISTLDLNGFSRLQSLLCRNNKLTNLSLNGAMSMFSASIFCSNNLLTSLNIAGMPYLTSLYFENNQISTISISGLNELQTIKCDHNQLTSLNLSNLPKLENLYCYNNQLTSLDLNEFPMLKDIRCNDNNLREIFYKNGIASYSNFDFSLNPNLEFICVDEWKIPRVSSDIKYYGYSATCNTNSYCSFEPGGIFYIVKGDNRFDSNNDGCDATDMIIPNLKFSLSNGTTTGVQICDNTGAFTFPVGAGIHILKPVLENPNYFKFSPSNISINFPSQVSPYTQNFCLIPNSNHPDLEMVLLPLNIARPGFISEYKIIYKNKGTNVQSGTIDLQYNGLISNLSYSIPKVLDQTASKFVWEFNNLLPFETREIQLHLNINKPTDSSPVNAGDNLNYIVNISSSSLDETPKDNTFVLNQTVVNSYDPNDKTCLEGSIITPSLIGEYVHYMIRFENTGTYQAQNIVVKDMIDLSKFDISTLIPTSSSHSFVTKISEGNKVEFIFENINLPFDDATNDGYIAFKIKTKPTLVVGDTFANEANIYFDYNFPILTNKATSKFQNTLANPDFEFSNYFALYPNPANNVLNINTKQAIEIEALVIYDILGQLVIAVPNAKSVSSIDVSQLRAGTYFLKVKSDKGSSGIKFIKN